MEDRALALLESERIDRFGWTLGTDRIKRPGTSSTRSCEETPDLSGTVAPDGTVTLALTDIEGSTALNASFGDRAWLEGVHAHNQVVTSVTLEQAGRS